MTGGGRFLAPHALEHVSRPSPFSCELSGDWRGVLATAYVAAQGQRQGAGAPLKGNTHLPFADMNNVAVADLLSKLLAENRLDAR